MLVSFQRPCYIENWPLVEDLRVDLPYATKMSVDTPHRKAALNLETDRAIRRSIVKTGIVRTGRRERSNRKKGRLFYKVGSDRHP